jgi:hypothetical protein
MNYISTHGSLVMSKIERPYHINTPKKRYFQRKIWTGIHITLLVLAASYGFTLLTNYVEHQINTNIIAVQHPS